MEGEREREREREREFTKPVAGFGECVARTLPLHVGEDKFDVGWKEGVWLGIKSQSGESLTGTGEGVAKAKDFRRKPENGGQWNKEVFDVLRGAPWEPYRGEVHRSTVLRRI